MNLRTGNEIRNDNLLIITSRDDITADLVVKRLYERATPFVRFNTEDFPLHCAGSITISSNSSGCEITTDKWTLNDSMIRSVWYRRPKVSNFEGVELSRRDRGFAERETIEYLDNLWYALRNLKWVNHPHVLCLAERKAVQLSIAEQMGFLVPATLISNDYSNVTEFVNRYSGSVVAKPLSHGLYGDSEEFGIFANDLSSSQVDFKKSEIELCPFIIQRKIDKKYDVRLNLFGSTIFAHRIIPNPANSHTLDWRTIDPGGISYAKIDPPNNIVDSIRKFATHLKLEFGAFDFAVDEDNQWYFIEVNPSGQFAWLELATGDPLIDALIDTLQCECKNGLRGS